MTIVSPPQASGTNSRSTSCWRTRVGSASSRSTLVIATMIGTSAAPRVVDRLDGLRHHAVVGRDHEDRDVGRVRAPGAHRRERLVTGRVDERDRVPVAVGLVRTDVLGDPTRLTGHHVGVTDGVEQRGLPVVDVAEHGHDRGTRLEVGVVLVVVVTEQGLQLELGLLTGLDQQHLRTECLGDELDHLVGQRLRAGDHFAGVEQQPHEVGGRSIQLGRELLDGAAALDDDLALGNGRVRRRELRHRRRTEVFEVATAALLAPGPLTLWAGSPTTAGASAGTTRTATGATATATGATTGTATGTLEPTAPPAPPWAVGSHHRHRLRLRRPLGREKFPPPPPPLGPPGPPGPPEPGVTRGPGGGGMRRPAPGGGGIGRPVALTGGAGGAAGSVVAVDAAAGSGAAAAAGRSAGAGAGAGAGVGAGAGAGAGTAAGGAATGAGRGAGAPTSGITPVERTTRCGADAGTSIGGSSRSGTSTGAGAGAGSSTVTSVVVSSTTGSALALVLAAVRLGLGSGSGASTTTSRRRPSLSARRRTRSAEGSSMLDEWLLTPIFRRSARSRTTWFSTPSSLASS